MKVEEEFRARLRSRCERLLKMLDAPDMPNTIVAREAANIFMAGLGLDEKGASDGLLGVLRSRVLTRAAICPTCETKRLPAEASWLPECPSCRAETDALARELDERDEETTR